jgi:hypothetical protein
MLRGFFARVALTSLLTLTAQSSEPPVADVANVGVTLKPTAEPGVELLELTLDLAIPNFTSDSLHVGPPASFGLYRAFHSQAGKWTLLAVRPLLEPDNLPACNSIEPGAIGLSKQVRIWFPVKKKTMSPEIRLRLATSCRIGNEGRVVHVLTKPFALPER